MRWTVQYDYLVERRIAEFWAASADRAAMSEALDDLDVRLQREPLRTGFPYDEADPPESAVLDIAFRMNRLPENLRVARAGRLRVAFSVHVDDRTVVVWTAYEATFDEL